MATQRKVIRDIAGLKESIEAWFDFEEAEAGVFRKRGKYDNLLKRVMSEIDDYTSFETDPALECQHKWRDYDWILLYHTSNAGKNFCYEIVEPYVCIHCGKRKDVTLENGVIAVGDATSNSIYENLKKQYPKIKDRPIVEDEINDAILVDREYLRIADYLRGNADIAKKVELKIGGASDAAVKKE